MMSRRHKRDYTAVFKHMKEIIPTMNPIRLVTDFEAAIWYGARKIFPNIAISECNFHCGQALWRKVQELGLAVAYHTSGLGLQNSINRSRVRKRQIFVRARLYSVSCYTNFPEVNR